MNDKISLAGDLGSGKSTVAPFLLDHLGAECYSTGAIVRKIAERRGMTVVELNQYMETHPEIDHEIDRGLEELSTIEKPLVIDSRMAWHFTAGTFRVYLSTDPEVSAARILAANRKGEHAKDLASTLAETKARRASEQKRYMEQYGVDIKDLSNYDFVIDTTYIEPIDVANAILVAFEKWQADKSYRAVMIAPERLHYPDDEVPAAELLALSNSADEGAPLPPVPVFEKDGEFYTDTGAALAITAALCGKKLMDGVLIPGSPDGKTYVKMCPSL